MKTLLLTLFVIHSGCIYSQLGADDYGPNAILFASITRFDSTRAPVAGQIYPEKGRIHQINVWWPSSSQSNKMRFADYVELISGELQPPARDRRLQNAIDKYFAWPASLHANRKSFEKYLADSGPMRASRGKLKPVNAPLVMLLHGFAADYAFMAEFLASHGFAVIQVPVKGSTTYELDYEGDGLKNQVLDYEFAWKILQQEFKWRAESMAVAGFSFGAQSAVIISMRNSRVKALVSLDGGIGSEFGANLVGKHVSYDLTNFSIPLLHLYNQRDPYSDLSWFKLLSDEKKFIVPIRNMDHGYFTSFGKLRSRLPDIMGIKAPDPNNGYDAVVLMTKEFISEAIRGTLKKDFIHRLTRRDEWISFSLD